MGKANVVGAGFDAVSKMLKPWGKWIALAGFGLALVSGFGLFAISAGILVLLGMLVGLAAVEGSRRLGLLLAGIALTTAGIASVYGATAFLGGLLNAIVVAILPVVSGAVALVAIREIVDLF